MVVDALSRLDDGRIESAERDELLLIFESGDVPEFGCKIGGNQVSAAFECLPDLIGEDSFCQFGKSDSLAQLPRSDVSVPWRSG